jgi:chromosome partitioning protein
MALVITLAQQKGGTGKTTLAANLAAALARDRRVAVLDIDPQRSLARWHDLRAAQAKSIPPITTSDVSGWRLGGELDRLRGGHDAIVIDSPPRIDTDARLAVRAASLVLVPVQPSLPDVWAADATLKLAAEERRPVALVLNRVPPSSRLRDTIVADLRARGLTLLDAGIGNRAGFAHAFALGLGIIEAAPRSTGAAEVLAMVSEMMERVR